MYLSSLVLLLLVSTSLASLFAPAASAQIAKKCDGGISLKLSAASVPQGALVQAEVAAAKILPAQSTAEWNDKPSLLWGENGSPKSLHGLIGVDLETVPGRYEWKVSWVDAAGKPLTCTAVVTVRSGKFPTERLKVEKQFVEPDPSQEKRAEADQQKMHTIYDTMTPQALWKGKFRLPLDGVKTGGNFGRRRVLNGQPRSPHAGVDFPAAAGTPVFASQSGKVVLAEELYYSGNTIVIDHGFGIYTMYAHLSQVDVKPGDTVEATTQIGEVGATGRVTGPHLHWGLTVQHARVNAMGIVQRRP
jgi:murein DD-endopeptidase MepM/ murein hydrolase activator NlpD